MTEHDAAGNLTYDGVYQYAYDAWNRMVKVTKAYRDPSSPGTVSLGSVVHVVATKIVDSKPQSFHPLVDKSIAFETSRRTPTAPKLTFVVDESGCSHAAIFTSVRKGVGSRFNGSRRRRTGKKKGQSPFTATAGGLDGT